MVSEVADTSAIVQVRVTRGTKLINRETYNGGDPSGVHEFSCGAFNDENSRMGRKPGDPKSTDPDALVGQKFTSLKPTGGFITVTIDPGEGDAKASIAFEFYDDLGKKLYRYWTNEK